MTDPQKVGEAVAGSYRSKPDCQDRNLEVGRALKFLQYLIGSICCFGEDEEKHLRPADRPNDLAGVKSSPSNIARRDPTPDSGSLQALPSRVGDVAISRRMADKHRCRHGIGSHWTRAEILARFSRKDAVASLPGRKSDTIDVQSGGWPGVTSNFPRCKIRLLAECCLAKCAESQRIISKALDN